MNTEIGFSCHNHSYCSFWPLWRSVFVARRITEHWWRIKGLCSVTKESKRCVRLYSLCGVSALQTVICLHGRAELTQLLLVMSLSFKTWKSRVCRVKRERRTDNASFRQMVKTDSLLWSVNNSNLHLTATTFTKSFHSCRCSDTGRVRSIQIIYVILKYSLQVNSGGI